MYYLFHFYKQGIFLHQLMAELILKTHLVHSTQILQNFLEFLFDQLMLIILFSQTYLSLLLDDSGIILYEFLELKKLVLIDLSIVDICHVYHLLALSDMWESRFA